MLSAGRQRVNVSAASSSDWRNHPADRPARRVGRRAKRCGPLRGTAGTCYVFIYGNLGMRLLAAEPYDNLTMPRHRLGGLVTTEPTVGLVQIGAGDRRPRDEVSASGPPRRDRSAARPRTLGKGHVRRDRW